MSSETSKAEAWIAEHSIRIFLVIAVLILTGAYFVVSAFLKSGEAAHEVDVLKPQVTKIYAAAAACAPKTIARDGGEERCSRLLTVALRNCRQAPKCRAAFLAILTYPPPARSTVPSSTAATTTAPDSKGGATQQPSNHGHQPPGPGKGPRGGGDEGEAQETSPTPSPAPSAPEGGSGEAPAQESPGNSAEGGSSSGADVEVCALERTCVGIEVGLNPKGLAP